jgi:hypothetical protein
MLRCNLRSAAWLAVALTLVAVNTARADQEMKWKFKQGDKLNYALKQQADILIDANGVEFDIKVAQIMDLTWDVKSVAADGTVELTQTVDRVQLKMSTPFTGEFAYDSKDEANAPQGEIWDRMGGPVKALVGGVFQIKLKPNGKVEEIKLPEKLAELLAEAGGGGAQSMMMGGGLFTESAIKQVIEQSILELPEGTVADGATWSKKLENKLGPIGTQKFDTTLTFEGAESRDGLELAKIATKTEMTFEPNADSDVDIEMEVTEQEGAGNVLFDTKAGRVIESKNVQKMTLEGDFMGNEFAQEIVMTLLLKQGTSEDLPKDEAEAPEAAAAESAPAESAK